MRVNLKIQLKDEKRWNQKVSQRSKLSPLRYFQAVSNIIASKDANQDKGLHDPKFITLGNLSEQEKIEIIQTGFQRQAEAKIS